MEPDQNPYAPPRSPVQRATVATLAHLSRQTLLDLRKDARQLRICAISFGILAVLVLVFSAVALVAVAWEVAHRPEMLHIKGFDQLMFAIARCVGLGLLCLLVTWMAWRRPVWAGRVMRLIALRRSWSLAKLTPAPVYRRLFGPERLHLADIDDALAQSNDPNPDGSGR
jgi:hypothetical protein